MVVCFLYRNRSRLTTPTKKERDQTRTGVCYEQGWCLDRLLGGAHVTRRNESANERPIERVLTSPGALETPVRPFGPVCIPRACALKVASEQEKKLRVYGRLRHEACPDCSMYRRALTPRCPTATTRSPRSPRTSTHAVSPESLSHHPSYR